MGGALKTEFLGELMVVIFSVPPFFILDNNAFILSGGIFCVKNFKQILKIRKSLPMRCRVADSPEFLAVSSCHGDSK